MNSEEKIAQDYFKKEKINNIIHEPLGNVTPDFLLNNNVAVEVRRLNKHYKGEPLEKLEYGELRKIENFIQQYKSEKKFDATSAVSLEYQRPLIFNKIKSELKSTFDTLSRNKKFNEEIRINENLAIYLFPLEERHESEFEVLGWVDHNRGGFVLKDLVDNINIVLKEKEIKIQKSKKQFSIWWLVLINYISYSISENELNRIKNLLPSSSSFSKIIILDPLKYKPSIINYS